MKYHTLFVKKIREDVAIFVVVVIDTLPVTVPTYICRQPQPKYLLCVLKRTISMIRIDYPKHVHTDGINQNAPANSAKFRGIRPRMYIEDLL